MGQMKVWRLLEYSGDIEAIDMELSMSIQGVQTFKTLAGIVTIKVVSLGRSPIEEEYSVGKFETE